MTDKAKSTLLMGVKKFLKFCSWNIEGLSGKSDDEDFLSIIDSFDFISLVESWLSQNTVNIQGFYSFSKCRQKSVFVKSELRKGVIFFDKESSEEFVWWKLEKEFFHLKQDLFVCSVYIPPHNSP